MRYRIVDVFSDRALAGNQLCVVLDDCDESLMQAVAREVNLSETTFPVVTGPASYSNRIFTPSAELPFAGHPSLGTAWALLDGRSFVIPQDIERLFAPVLVHRVVFTPGFVARARATGWAEAVEEFRQSCLALAPQPGSEDDALFEDGVRPVSHAGAESASADPASREPLKPGASRRDRGEPTTTG